MKTFLIFVILCFSFSANANIWSGHIRPTLTDGFDWKGFAIIGIGASGVALTQPYYDDEIYRNFKNYQRMNSSASKIGDYLGTGVPGVAIALGQLLLDTDNGISHSEALVFTFVTTSILKYVNKRRRPDSNNTQAMPSGHTSTAFATATALSYAYGWKAAVLAYPIATFVAVSRWSDNAHWLSDTIAGATIGIFWGRASALHHQSGSSTAYFYPIPVDKGAGLGMTAIW